ASSTAHGIRQSVEAGKSQRHYRRHSRAWWRRYRARLRARRAAAALAALAHRNAPLAPVTTSNAPGTVAASASTPQLPTGWNKTASNAGELKFKTDSGDAAVPGQASLSVVALSRPNPVYLTAREQRRVLSGVALSDLRRIVIDKMITSGGWVINDYEREVTGHRVFIVTAQTPGDGRSPEKSWNFYFTEVNGRIYSLTTNTPAQSANRMAVEAERFMTSLYPTGDGDSQKANR
ncbi:MAG: hypothetical protein ACRD6N_05260, partial [Pyrinomonadaceae bacterium]